MPSTLPISPRFPLEQLLTRLRWEDIRAENLQPWLDLCRAEDVLGSGLTQQPQHRNDVTTACIGDPVQGKAMLVARAPLIVCGLPLIPMILKTYGSGCSFLPHVADGEKVDRGSVLGTLEGEASLLLQAERLLLNCLQHLCGIATQTAQYVVALQDSPTRLLDTRKTTPGCRLLEKYAVACGGAWNHRMGLFDRILFKDNHRALAHAHALPFIDFVKRARHRYPDLPLEVEVDCLQEIEPLLTLGVDILLLDNFSAGDLAKAVTLIDQRAYTEASGTLRFEDLPTLADLGLNFISCGALTHQSTWVDIGLDWSW